MQVPVAFFVFNRPDTTAKVFAAIRKARPARLLLVADGPRPHVAGEAERVRAVRGILKVDWKCKVQRNFSAQNLGCRQRLSSGLTWAFEQAPEAIILEDDCLPSPDFFRYCQALLGRYRNDESVMMVCGSILRPLPPDGSSDYYFSRYGMVWGWASWRRAWRHYDERMADWPGLRRNGLLKEVFPNDPMAQRYWEDHLQAVWQRRLNTWDYQWVLALWKNKGLSVLPRKNLVQNIGIGPGATHGGEDSPTLMRPHEGIRRWPLRAPREMRRDLAADDRMEKALFSGPEGPGPRARIRRRFQALFRRWA